MSTDNSNRILEHIAVLRESLLDCDIVVDDKRAELEAAIRQRTEVVTALEDAIAAIDVYEQDDDTDDSQDDDPRVSA